MEQNKFKFNSNLNSLFFCQSKQTNKQTTNKKERNERFFFLNQRIHRPFTKTTQGTLSTRVRRHTRIEKNHLEIVLEYRNEHDDECN